MYFLLPTSLPLVRLKAVDGMGGWVFVSESRSGSFQKKTSRQDGLRWKAWIKISPETKKMQKLSPNKPTNQPTKLGCSQGTLSQFGEIFFRGWKPWNFPWWSVEMCRKHPVPVHYTSFPSFRRDIDLHKLSQNENTSAKKTSHLKNSQKGPLKTRSPSSTKISKRKDPEKQSSTEIPRRKGLSSNAFVKVSY